MVVATHASLVGEEYARSVALDPSEDRGHSLVTPLGYQSGVLILGTVRRLLRAKDQGTHDFAHGGKTELNLELALDERGDEGQGPQAKAERELTGTMFAHEEAPTAELLRIGRGWASQHFLGMQTVLPWLLKVATTARGGTSRSAAISAADMPLR